MGKVLFGNQTHQRVEVRIVIADSRREAISVLKREGESTSDLHFKKTDSISNQEQQLRQNFALLASVHSAMPENTATPVALVVGRNGDALWYLTVKIEGDTLEERFRAAKEARTASAAMAFSAPSKNLVSLIGKLHSKGLYHGDLQRDNVIITPSGTLKLLDTQALRTIPAGQEYDRFVLQRRVISALEEVDAGAAKSAALEHARAMERVRRISA